MQAKTCCDKVQGSGYTGLNLCDSFLRSEGYPTSGESKPNENGKSNGRGGTMAVSKAAQKVCSIFDSIRPEYSRVPCNK